MKVKGSITKQEGELSISKGEMGVLGKFIGNIIPGFLKEEMGIMQDNARFRRYKNFLRISKEANKLLKKSGQIPHVLPLRLSLPFIESASLEDETLLQDKWANLLANISISNAVSDSSYIDTLKNLTQEDARALDRIFDYIDSKSKENSFPQLMEGTPWLYPFSEDVFIGNDAIKIGKEETVTLFLNLAITKDKLKQLKLVQKVRVADISDLEQDIVNEVINNDTSSNTEWYMYTPFGYAFVKACRRPI